MTSFGQIILLALPFLPQPVYPTRPSASLDKLASAKMAT
jgi:hypothetical protein